MAIGTNDALANKRLDMTFKSAAGINFDGGALKFYNGSRPANANTALGAQTEIAQVTLATPAFNAAASRANSLPAALQELAADNAGTITWARLTSSGATYVIDFTVTATGGGGDITVDNPTLVAGQQFNVTSLSFSE